MVRRLSRPLDVAIYSPAVGKMLANPAGPAAGGAQVQLLLLARALAKRGHRVAFLVTAEHGVRLPASCEGVAVRQIAEWRPRRFLVPGVSLGASVVTLAGRIATARARIYIHRSASAEAFSVALAARATGSRFVYASANVIDFEFRALESRRPYAALFDKAVSLADEIVVQTHEQEMLCQTRFGREPIRIASMSPFASAADVDPSPGYFLWAGRLAPYKQPERVLELARALPEAHFVIVGGPDISDNGLTERRVKKESATHTNVTFLGEQSHEDVRRLLGSAVAVINTTRWEGMPNVFLEAWACGVPVVALEHDPDGVIEREGLGAFAGGDIGVLISLARELWVTRHDRAHVATRCQKYVAREHSIHHNVMKWECALGLA